jgi:6-phosphogluconolactonase (cycloisomerase 2 family)
VDNQNDSSETGAVFFVTNEEQGQNKVVMLRRAANGSLEYVGAYATGGSGAGKGPDEPFADPLGSQGALALSHDGQFLFVVNAGSSEISSFRVQPNGLSLVGKVSSGGNFPVSLALHGNLLYVLNAGGEATILGFRVQLDGRLKELEGSLRTLGVGGKEPPYVFNAPGHVLFNPTGDKLVVVGKGIHPEDQSTHKLYVFPLNAADQPEPKPATTLSHGNYPFAAAFDQNGNLLVVEVFGRGPVLTGNGAVSSYAIKPDGALQVIDGTVENNQDGSCWITTTNCYAYVNNFGGFTISGYRVGKDSRLQLLTESGVSATTGNGSHPVDLAATADGRFLYALLPGTSEVATYAINRDGSLADLGRIKGEWPIYVQGLAVM